MPRWLAGSGRGWVTAEYGMLPASTGERKQRDVDARAPRRAHGRDPAPDRPRRCAASSTSPRSASTRSTSTATSSRPTAARAAPRSPAPTSRWRWRASACARRRSSPAQPAHRARSPRCRAASSTASPLLDLDYAEDSTAEVDANVVMTGDGGLVEVQATAERTPLSRAHLDDLLGLAAKGIEELARRRRRRRRRGGEARPRHAQRAQGARVRGPARRRSTSSRCRTTSSCRPRRARRSPRTRSARRARPRRRPGAPAIADDSGIEAAALGGAPGVRSARFAGEDATDEENLASCCARRRRAARCAYVCAIAYVDGDVERLFEGRCTGTLAAEPRGDGRLRLRPRVPARRRARRPHDGGARRRRRRTRSATAAGPRARCSRGSPATGRAGPLAQVDRRACADRPEHRRVAL